MNIIIELRDVWKIYKEKEEGEVDALKNFRLHVKRGDFIAVMGPSGSGKTTAMNLIGSLDTPTRGQIFLDGHNISHLSESDLAQIRGRRIGFVFQQFNLIPNLTAKENVILPMIFQGKDEFEREKKAIELFKMVELEDRMNHYPSELSGGQQQRVAIARALANDPEVILADEPTGNLDTHSGEVVMKFLNELNSKGRTIVLVTHSPEIAMKHSRKIYWIRDGQIEKITEKIKGDWKTLKKHFY